MCRLVSLETNYGSTVRVADIKKDSILNIIEAAHNCASINEIILFGSSLQERCHENSDIDIAVVSNVKRSKLFNSKTYRDFTRQIYMHRIGQDYDILQFDSAKEIEDSKDAVCQDIKRDGKVIYRREQHV